MSYHPSSLPPGQSATGKAPLRLIGTFLSLLGMLLAILAIFFHASIADSLVAMLIGLFSLRVFFLWFGANKMENEVRPGNTLQPTASWAVEGTHQPSNDAYPAEVAQQSANGQAHMLSAQYLQYQQQQQYQRYQQSPSSPQYAPIEMPAPAVYALQPAFTPAGAYIHRPAPTIVEAYQQPVRPSQPYVPIAEDAMFDLDRPGANECCFILPKEGEPLVECQDRYALNSSSRCYAVADGVAGSFVPGPWARTIAQGFVGCGGEFASKDDFQHWLADCSDRWHSWMEERWVPTMNALRERNGDPPGDWSNDIRQGAQTTLIGCSLHRGPDINDVSTLVQVFAAGDSEFFHFSPTGNGGWKLARAFPFTDPAEFNARPHTLVSLPRADLLERAWLRRKTMLINVYPGDRLVLASDTLAKWLLGQVRQGNASRWMPLLTCEDAGEFEQQIRNEFYIDHVEDDDVTMLIIPIS